MSLKHHSIDVIQNQGQAYPARYDSICFSSMSSQIKEVRGEEGVRQFCFQIKSTAAQHLNNMQHVKTSKKG